MNPKAVLLSVSILLIGLLYAIREARMMVCLERGGIECCCCAGQVAADSAETLSPCSCPCPGVDQVFPFPQDCLAARVPPKLNLLSQWVALTPDPIFLTFLAFHPRNHHPIFLTLEAFFNPERFRRNSTFRKPEFFLKTGSQVEPFSFVTAGITNVYPFLPCRAGGK
jgi:hypothetical protein